MTDPKEVTFFGKEAVSRNVAWYEASLAHDPAKRDAAVRGDVSSWYARASLQSVAAAHRLLPDAKLILIIRNPVDRAWSHLLMELAFDPHRDLSRVSDARIIQHCERRRQIRFGEYQRTIDHWTAYYPREALHVEVYDRLAEDQAGFLRDILAHIGADASWQPSEEMLRSRIWSTKEATGGRANSLAMPEFVRWYLSRQWLESTRRLNDRMNGRLDSWVEQMQAVVGRPAPTTWRVKRAAHRAARLPLGAPHAIYNGVRELRLGVAYQRLETTGESPAGRRTTDMAARPYRRDLEPGHPGEIQANSAEREDRNGRKRSNTKGFVIKPVIAGACASTLGVIVALARIVWDGWRG